jgi:hypothetical protein
VILPPRLEPQRAEIEKRLTPLPDPRGLDGGFHEIHHLGVRLAAPQGIAAPKMGVIVWGCPR